MLHFPKFIKVRTIRCIVYNIQNKSAQVCMSIASYSSGKWALLDAKKEANDFKV